MPRSRAMRAQARRGRPKTARNLHIHHTHRSSPERELAIVDRAPCLFQIVQPLEPAVSRPGDSDPVVDWAFLAGAIRLGCQVSIQELHSTYPLSGKVCSITPIGFDTVGAIDITPPHLPKLSISETFPQSLLSAPGPRRRAGRGVNRSRSVRQGPGAGWIDHVHHECRTGMSGGSVRLRHRSRSSLSRGSYGEGPARSFLSPAVGASGAPLLCSFERFSIPAQGMLAASARTFWSVTPSFLAYSCGNRGPEPTPSRSTTIARS